MRDRFADSLVAVAALLFAAVCMNFSWVHMWHDGDSILLALISIDRWVPFYWGDRRYGMPVPFLASWIDDPVWNLLFQTQLFAVAIVGLLLVTNLFFLHAKGTDRNVRAATACMALVLCLLVYRPTSRTARNYLLADPYVISLAPLLLAIALVFRVERGTALARLLFALPLVFLSLWINYSHVLLAGLFALLIPHDKMPWRKTLMLRGALAASAGGFFWLIRRWASQYPRMGEAGFAPDQWFTAASRLLSTMTETVVYPAALVMLLGAGAIAGVVARRFGAARLSDGVVFGLSAVVFALAAATSDWPMRNNFEPRYWTTPLVLLLLAGSAWVGRAAIAGLELISGSRALTVGIAVLLVVSASIKVFGVPSPPRARGLLIGTTGKWSQDAIKLGCTHMVGEYSIAWMSVFHARATGHQMWAVVDRAEPTRDLWDNLPRESRRYCGDVRNPGAIQRSFVLFGIELPPPSGSSGRMVRFEYAQAK